MKTVDVQAKEWFDKVNGNSYFSAVVTVDFGQPSEKTYKLPFQYGFGSHYEFQAAKEIGFDSVAEMRRSGITVNCSIQTRCKQRDVKNWVK
jgi:hypothetical protein